jgi:hypothetical protein
MERMERQETQINSLIGQLKAKNVSPSPQNNYSHLDAVNEDRRLRSLVLSNVNESNAASPVDRAEEDYQVVKTIMGACGIEGKPMAVFRMGTPPTGGGRPRLIKLELHGKGVARQMLRNRKLVKNLNGCNVYIRESLTKFELDERRKLILTCNKTREEANNKNEDDDYVVYNKQVILRSAIPKRNAN